MNNYFFDLNIDLKKFIKHIDYKKLFSIDSPNIVKVLGENHKIYYIKTDDIITTSGVNYLNKIGIFLREVHCFFELKKNHIGKLHVDNVDKTAPDFAINIVLEGDGKMEWVEIESSEREKIYFIDNDTTSVVRYVDFSDIQNFKIVSTWNGNTALVNRLIPHRVIGGNLDRYTLSLRTIDALEPKKLVEAAKLFTNNYIITK